ncbi:hypothetical protein [Mesorhizobium sp.]|nr:hypothetical protein [Mesorhizobium sp.]
MLYARSSRHCRKELVALVFWAAAKRGFGEAPGRSAMGAKLPVTMGL